MELLKKLVARVSCWEERENGDLWLVDLINVDEIDDNGEKEDLSSEEEEDDNDWRASYRDDNADYNTSDEPDIPEAPED